MRTSRYFQASYDALPAAKLTASMHQGIIFITVLNKTRSIWKMLGPFATASRRHIAIHQVSPLYCRTPPAHRCPRRQRQRVTEGTAMAPWNGPNKHWQDWPKYWSGLTMDICAERVRLSAALSSWKTRRELRRRQRSRVCSRREISTVRERVPRSRRPASVPTTTTLHRRSDEVSATDSTQKLKVNTKNTWEIPRSQCRTRHFSTMILTNNSNVSRLTCIHGWHTSQSCDHELWHMTTTFKHRLDRVKNKPVY